MSSSPSFLDPIVLPLITGQSVLDVACGLGRWGHLIECNFWEAGLPAPPQIDGVDALPANVARCARLSSYHEVWQAVLPTDFHGRQWDTVLACEILEHLPQDQVTTALDQLEAAAAKRIIVSTPNWPAYREGHDTIVGFNQYEAHLSYIPRRVLCQRGYRIIGAGLGNPANLSYRAVRALRKYAPVRSHALDSLAQALLPVADSIVAYRDTA